MGYESKIFIVDRHELKNYKTNETVSVAAEKIAMVDMSKCDYSFVELFENETDYGIYLDGNGNDEITFDMYGVHITDASISEVYSWLIEKQIWCKEMGQEFYRRYAILLALLQGFMQTEWGNGLRVVHFGY